MIQWLKLGALSFLLSVMLTAATFVPVLLLAHGVAHSRGDLTTRRAQESPEHRRRSLTPRTRR